MDVDDFVLQRESKRENEQLRQENEELRREKEQLQRENEKLRRENEKLQFDKYQLVHADKQAVQQMDSTTMRKIVGEPVKEANE